MKLPDLTDVSEAGVVEHHGAADALAHAAADAKLRYLAVDLAKADSKAAVLAALGKGLELPEHFGDNWDALADCLEDRDWLGKTGCVIRISHGTAMRKAHPHDWETLEEILAEACEFWHERHVPFWVFVA
jgi:RNAse (barnase) inhibitor barstar